MPNITGLLCCFILACTSLCLAQLAFLAHAGISALVIAIVGGIVIGNTLQLPPSLSPGIQFSAKKLLRLAIVLYGFKISLQEIVFAGWRALFLDSFSVFGILLLGYWLGTRLFKLEKKLALLISAGTAICGAAAVLAIEDIINSKSYQTSIAVACVVLFGTLAMFTYPVLQSAWLHLPVTHYGLWSGASIHEVAQVVVAGNPAGAEATNIAVITKMLRVLLLVPVLLALSLRSNRGVKGTIKLPWFVFGFAAMIVLHSLIPFSVTTQQAVNQLDLLLLTMAMGAIGLETKLAKIRQVGLRPFYFAAGISIMIAIQALVLVKMLYS